jgi:hypothetical protein
LTEELWVTPYDVLIISTIEDIPSGKLKEMAREEVSKLKVQPDHVIYKFDRYLDFRSPHVISRVTATLCKKEIKNDE